MNDQVLIDENLVFYFVYSYLIIQILFTFSYTEYRGSIVIVQKIEIEIFTNLDVLHLSESEKTWFCNLVRVSVCVYVCLCVCEHDSMSTVRARLTKFHI